ncbi:HAD family hydrolase [Pajaroellobacter abortibovis]|uniref:Uncharacterized protein n=1 Tax=Pajaroellobacter abortibovis TaxID=1882918 RepID=A0A1L6MWQ9_9BACT|nr:haloacid dehalogenase-like hydrolase [Pajaroellobacter abortibovis]APR99990.1 hypothetical protein BCY86_04300 [Pajaroellobacter abortibovis]
MRLWIKFERVIRKAIYPEAANLVRQCIRRGHQVVFAWGAFDFVVKRLAAYLKTAMITNRLEVREKYATGKLVRPIVAGLEKARLIRAYAQACEHSLEDCIATSIHRRMGLQKSVIWRETSFFCLLASSPFQSRCGRP